MIECPFDPDEREVVMHARVSTYQGGDPDKIVEGFKSVTPQLEDMDGFSHALFLVDPQTGNAMTITVWDTEEALNAGAAQASKLRQQGTQPSGASIGSVDHYQVAMTVGNPTHA
jgi:heme-degrading monooxygenase HmoA